MKNIKCKIVVFSIITLCFLLQTTILQAFKLASVIPNLLIIFTSSMGFMRGKKDGLLVGFISGLLLDIFYGPLIGFYALLYMLIGYGNGCFQRLFYDDDIKLPLVMIGLSDLFYGIAVYVVMFLLRSKFNFGQYLKIIILPEFIYTMLLTLLVYQLIRRLNRWIEHEKKRSVGKFV